MYTYLSTPTPTPRKPIERPLLLLLFLLTLFLSSTDMYQVYLIGIPHFTDTLYVFEKKWMEGVGVLGVGVGHLGVQVGFGRRLGGVSFAWWGDD